ncbi:endonuclease domain-containing protein [Amycolatopsis taiwanensis]|uniref:endonuclease domain-containing protein n=1 Tax=Amycolatopsis taiwanensis TaxID=342230 RepID=UPI002554C0FA|nr:DUF559 domain-containing protein [Amycolatopsis taiwanensis]
MESLPKGLHGAHTRAQLSRVLSPYALRRALRDRRLSSFSREVLVEPDRETEFRTRAAAALLFAGPHAVLAGHSALAMHGCSAADTAPIHVLLPYHRKLRRRPGVVVHNGRFEESDVLELHGLHLLALDVALAEVLCRGSRRAGIACADQALALHSKQERAEFRAWTEHRIRSRPDSRGRRQGLALLDQATGLAESPAESWMLLALADAGLPVPVPQFTIFDLAGNEIYRLDFAWPELRVAVEYDGYVAHEGRQGYDTARDEDLRRRGWTVIRADADDLREPARLIAAINSAFRARGLAA